MQKQSIMESLNECCLRDSSADSLQAERGHSQGDAGGELGEEHIEGVEDGLVAFRVGVGQSEVIHHIWQHGPGMHTCVFNIRRHSKC